MIYRILKSLEAGLDSTYIGISAITHTALRISYERWEALLIELQLSGYIRGLVFQQNMGEDRAHLVGLVHPTIALKGLEYLADNAMMKRVGNALRGIEEAIPGK